MLRVRAEQESEWAWKTREKQNREKNGREDVTGFLSVLKQAAIYVVLSIQPAYLDSLVLTFALSGSAATFYREAYL